jgi:hypothetical protein
LTQLSREIDDRFSFGNRGSEMDASWDPAAILILGILLILALAGFSWFWNAELFESARVECPRCSTRSTAMRQL